MLSWLWLSSFKCDAMSKWIHMKCETHISHRTSAEESHLFELLQEVYGSQCKNMGTCCNNLRKKKQKINKTIYIKWWQKCDEKILAIKDGRNIKNKSRTRFVAFCPKYINDIAWIWWSDCYVNWPGMSIHILNIWKVST